MAGFLLSRMRRFWSWLQLAPLPSEPRWMPHELAAYQQTQPHDGDCDEQTWRDVLCDDYLAEVGQHGSIFGRQYLYARLRCGHTAPAEKAQFRQLTENAAQTRQLTALCAPLRRAEAEVATTLFAGKMQTPPRWHAYLLSLPLLMLGLLLLTIVQGWMPALALALIAWMLMMIVQVSYQQAAEQFSAQTRTLQWMLHVFSTLPDTGDADQLRQALRVTKGLRRKKYAMFPLLQLYMQWFFLDNIRHYFRTLQLVRQQLAFLQQCYAEVAHADAMTALASHLQTQAHCWVSPADSQTLQFEDMRHPLVSNCAPVSVTLRRRGIFLSGKNAAGKSTFLRMLGLNTMLASAFGFAFARTASLPDITVISSMQNNDSLADGESTYRSELRRAQTLLSHPVSGPTLQLVDEIFRGTNYLESMAGATAVLRHLAKKGWVIVSSHNLLLADLLQQELVPMYVDSSPDRRQTRLLEGCLTEPNGLDLFAEAGIADDIQQEARRIFGQLNAGIVTERDTETGADSACLTSAG